MNTMIKRYKITGINTEEIDTSTFDLPSVNYGITDINTVSCGETIVPHQLMNERFIVLRPEDKLPLHNWSEPWYRFTADEIQKWINAGFNYALLYTTDIAVIDADNLDELEKYGILEKLPETYKVRSGRTSRRGMHFYFRIHNVPEEYQRRKILFAGDIGDLRLPGSPFYNTAPYSVHPVSGRQYLPVDAEVEICSVDFNELLNVLKPIILPLKSTKTAEDELKATGAQSTTSVLDVYNFDCFDFLSPLNPHTRADGEVEGAHPIHGSSTGTNLTISEDGTKWYCRAHNTGGGWIKALAVSAGIIQCEDANRHITPNEWKEINNVLRRLNPRAYRNNWLIWKKAQILEKTKQRRVEA